MRHGAALVVSHAESVTIVGPDGMARRFEGESADLVRVALEFWSAPHTEQELLEHLRALAGDCDPALVADTAGCLRAAGAIRAHEASPARRPTATNAGATRARVVLGISGAIAAIDAPALVRMLQARRFDVRVVMTAAARRFVTPGSLEALTHRPVIRGFWQKDGDGPAPHIQLATWADVVVLYPVTAATIARLANAACTDVLSALVTATTRPVLVAPSMNESMYLSPGVQRNLEQLRRDGRYLVQPVMGLEAAVAPSSRTPMSGAAPPPSQVVAAIELLAEQGAASRGRAAAGPVVGADAWDRQYEASAVGDLPWFTEQLDADLARELAAVKKGRLLDVGTGPGTAAIFAARNGFDVVATDVSSTALGIARRRANGERIAWVLDDFLDSRLWGRFDVLIDRGCLHCLPKSSWPDYARTAGRLMEPGGRLLLKVHAPEEAGRHGTNPAAPEELRAVFGEWFTLVGTHASEFDGTMRPSPKANLVVLTRSS